MNEKLKSQFKLLLKQMRIKMNNCKGKDFIRESFRVSSTSKVLKIIENFTKQIKSIDDIKDVQGIGKGSQSRINEILKTGKLSEIKIGENDNSYLESIEKLIKVFGIGKKKAHELVMDHGIKNLSDLRKLVKNRDIELPENIMKGLKYVDKTKIDIPRKEIDHIYLYLMEKAIKYDKNLNLLVCGSYRREKSTSGDIDIILYHNNIKTKKSAESSDTMKKFMDILVKDKFIIDNYTSYDVPTKFMGVCRYKKNPIRRIDIRMIPLESIHAATLYFTGSGDFNKKMRRVAMDMDLTLNEYGLYNSKGYGMNINSEKDVFDILGMEYLPPKLRK